MAWIRTHLVTLLLLPCCPTSCRTLQLPPCWKSSNNYQHNIIGGVGPPPVPFPLWRTRLFIDDNVPLLPVNTTQYLRHVRPSFFPSMHNNFLSSLLGTQGACWPAVRRYTQLLYSFTVLPESIWSWRQIQFQSERLCENKTLDLQFRTCSLVFAPSYRHIHILHYTCTVFSA